MKNNTPNTPIAKPTTQKKNESRYKATLSMGGLTTTAEGNDETIFSMLAMPKVTNKCLLTVVDNNSKAVFETVYPPFMAKKVMCNEYVQKFQWKRVLNKLA